MALSPDNRRKLTDAVLRVSPGDVDCDTCMEQIHAFVERALARRAIPEGLAVVRDHIEICEECREEYQALLEALREMDQSGH